MPNEKSREAEERIGIIEELVHGLAGRVNGIEEKSGKELSQFVSEYKQTLNEISNQIAIANKRYDTSKIQQHIDTLNGLVATIPKTIDVKNHHHFGAWSKSLIIALTISFFTTAGSLAIGLHLNERNNELSKDAHQYSLMKAFYPDLTSNIENKSIANPDSLDHEAEKAIIRRQEITSAEGDARQADRLQRAARRKLKLVRQGGRLSNTI